MRKMRRGTRVGHSLLTLRKLLDQQHASYICIVGESTLLCPGFSFSRLYDLMFTQCDFSQTSGLGLLRPFHFQSRNQQTLYLVVCVRVLFTRRFPNDRLVAFSALQFFFFYNSAYIIKLFPNPLIRSP